MVTPRVFDNWNWRMGVSKIPLIFRTCYLNNDTNGISETFRVSKRPMKAIFCAFTVGSWVSHGEIHCLKSWGIFIGAYKSKLRNLRIL